MKGRVFLLEERVKLLWFETIVGCAFCSLYANALLSTAFLLIFASKVVFMKFKANELYKFDQTRENSKNSTARTRLSRCPDGSSCINVTCYVNC